MLEKESDEDERETEEACHALLQGTVKAFRRPLHPPIRSAKAMRK